MQSYLVKKDPTAGLAAHIADAQGQPLCKTQLNPATWSLQTSIPAGTIVCYHCRRKQAHAEQVGIVIAPVLV